MGVEVVVVDGACQNEDKTRHTAVPSLEYTTHRSFQGSWWVTSAQADLHFYDAQGVHWTLEHYLQVYGHQPLIDTWVQLGVQARVWCRLIVKRVDASTAEQRRKHNTVRSHMPRHRKGAHRLGPKAAKRTTPRRQTTNSWQKHTHISAGRRRLADWTILLTTVPDELLNAEETLVLMRMRWQHELLWK